MITDWARKQVALILGGSSTLVPIDFIIGTGSSTVAVGNTSLVTATDRQAITGSDVSTLFKVKYTGDWTSAEISGTQLKEFGMIVSGGGLTGSIWSRSVIPALTFDGTQELRIEETFEVF